MLEDTLLIIGNGFDLQCGLKSSYKEFGIWLRQDEQRLYSSLWAVHFFLNNLADDQDWIDVEQSLQGTLTEKIYGRRSQLGNWLAAAKHYFTKYQGYMIKRFANEKGTQDREVKYIVKYMLDNNTSECDSYWFLNELRKFENLFSEYLETEVLNNKSYLPNACKLMEELTEGGKVKVISFNYTNPFKQNVSSLEKNKPSNFAGSVTNVHGTYADRNIIFGVDTTEDLPSDAYIFSKTHRKILQGSSNGALPHYVSKIKFYGHSLGRADYSYFQSIFDSYNLYGEDQLLSRNRGKNLKLQFYFTVYDEDKKIEIERDAANRVYKLIDAYGKTLDNKDKGKNLLHKLLLEGRIQIIFLPEIDKARDE